MIHNFKLLAVLAKQVSDDLEQHVSSAKNETNVEDLVAIYDAIEENIRKIGTFLSFRQKASSTVNQKNTTSHSENTQPLHSWSEKNHFSDTQALSNRNLDLQSNQHFNDSHTTTAEEKSTSEYGLNKVLHSTRPGHGSFQFPPGFVMFAPPTTKTEVLAEETEINLQNVGEKRNVISKDTIKLSYPSCHQNTTQERRIVAPFSGVPIVPGSKTTETIPPLFRRRVPSMKHNNSSTQQHIPVQPMYKYHTSQQIINDRLTDCTVSHNFIQDSSKLPREYYSGAKQTTSAVGFKGWVSDMVDTVSDLLNGLKNGGEPHSNTILRNISHDITEKGHFTMNMLPNHSHLSRNTSSTHPPSIFPCEKMHSQWNHSVSVIQTASSLSEKIISVKSLGDVPPPQLTREYVVGYTPLVYPTQG